MQRWMKSPPKIGILILFGLTVLLGGGYLMYSTWIHPLGPVLTLSTPTPGPTQTGAGITETPPTGATAAPGDTPTPTIEPVCGGPPTMTILVSGLDNTLADAVRVARVDFQHEKVAVLALPRDLWVDVEDIQEYEVVKQKLNQGYHWGILYDVQGGGSGKMAQILQNNYGLFIDHYVALQKDSFAQVIDAIGGITVNLPEDVYRKEFGEPKLYLKAGRHHLNGKQAEMLARHRIKIGDYGRIRNQTLILKAVAAKMLTPSGLKAIPDLVNRLRYSVVTDLSPSQISMLLCLAEQMDRDQDLTFVALPSEITEDQVVYDQVRETNTSALVGDDEGIRSLLQDFQAGRWP